MRTALTVALAAALALVARVPSAGQAPPSHRDLPDWIDRTQTYCMVPVLPETATKLHASVNGVWAGIAGTDPLLTAPSMAPAVQARYGADARAFAEACRKAGLVVCGVVNGIEGFPAMRADLPAMDEMACRDALGKPPQAGEMTLMCVNNPDWLAWEIARGKKAIDLGAECILVDTPMSASFVSGLLRGGFCQHCLANFRRHLEARFTPAQLRARFGLEAFDKAAVIARLSPQQGPPNAFATRPAVSAQDRALFGEFIRCQEQASFDTRKRLVDAVRAYATQQHRRVALCTNASDLGTVNPGGHWVRALMFAGMFDLFAYELNAEPLGMMSDQVTPYPRGKWAAYHRLAYAVYHRRSPAVIHASAMGKLLVDALTKGRTINRWMQAQCAEAYASGGAYIQYYIEPQAGSEVFLRRCWAGSAAQSAYVLAHRDLFDGEQRSGSSLAILFAMSERGRTLPAVCPSYLGFAQALTEANLPFDVLFAGDGHYVRDRLAAADLRAYRALVVPSPVAPTANQMRLIAAFVRAGGAVVCQEPGRLGLPATGPPVGAAPPDCVARAYRVGKGRVLVPQGAVTERGTGDVGERFLRTYDAGERARIARLAGALGLRPILPAQSDGLVCAFPVVQPSRNRVVVHLVNYDVDGAGDEIRAKDKVRVEIARPAFLSEPLIASVYAPGHPAETVPVASSGGRLMVTLPRLGVSADVVIEGREAARRPARATPRRHL